METKHRTEAAALAEFNVDSAESVCVATVGALACL